MPQKDQVGVSSLLMTGVKNLKKIITMKTILDVTDVNKTVGIIGMIKVGTEVIVDGIGHAMTKLMKERGNRTVTLRIPVPEAEAP